MGARMEELDRLADLVYPASPVDTPPPQRMPNWGPWRVGNVAPQLTPQETPAPSPVRGMYQPLISNKMIKGYNNYNHTMNVALDNSNDDNAPDAPNAPPAGPLRPCGLPW